jgi:outer membrane lipoprotein-sorting protein
MRLVAAAFAFLLMFPFTLAFADAGDQATVQAAEQYLNSIGTLKSRFVQTANDGSQAGGWFLLKRPGRLRFEYDKPITDFIVADGSMIYYYDGKMKQQSSAPISKSLADFFLRKNLNLSGDLRVSDVKRSKGVINLTMVQAKDPLSGSLTLILNEKPMALNAWRIVDSQGLVTTVTLSDEQLGVPLDNKNFHYYDPQHRESNFNN